MSEKPVPHAMHIFAHYAGQDLARWQTLIGQRAIHKTYGVGVVVDVTLGSGGKPIIAMAFPDDDKPSRSFTEEFLANRSFFTELSLPLDAATIATVRQELSEAGRKNDAADERRRAAQASAQLQRVKPSPNARRSHKMPSEALRDVLSVPTGDTSRYIIDYEVHAHPSSYSYRTTQYITFRMSGGRMWKIYDLGRAHIFVLNPHDPVAVRERSIATLTITEAEKQRVRGYFADRKDGGHFEKEYNEDFTFYVLPTDDNIELPHHPHRAQPNRNHTYFDLAELVRGEPIVRTLTDKGIER